MIMKPNSAPTKGVKDKLKSIEELGFIAAGLRHRGETLVLAHVNKGPDRPVFPDHIRAEMIASLECVDYVGINHAPSAENVLHAIKPDIYAKGREYAADDDDVTGKIVSERQAVEDGGGRLVFTDDITFSSSSLLNKHFNIYDPVLQQFLDMRRGEDALPRLVAIIDKVHDLKVTLVGDAIIDEYQYVEAMGKASKEAIIATRHQQGEMFAGGAVAAANHVAAFCREVELITCLGSDDSHEDLIRESLKENVKLTIVYKDGAPTTRKCRFIDHGYAVRKLFEVCYLDDRPLRPAVQKELDRRIGTSAAKSDLTIVNDFGHGMIGPSTIATLQAKARFLAVNSQTNSANQGFNLIGRYKRADSICIDGPEAHGGHGRQARVLRLRQGCGRQPCAQPDQFHRRHHRRRRCLFRGFRAHSLRRRLHAGRGLYRQRGGRVDGRHRRPSLVRGQAVAGKDHHRAAEIGRGADSPSPAPLLRDHHRPGPRGFPAFPGRRLPKAAAAHYSRHS